MRWNFLLLCLILIFRAGAQDGDTTNSKVGEIQDAEIVIEKSRKVNILKQERVSLPATSNLARSTKPQLSFERRFPNVTLPQFEPEIDVPEVEVPVGQLPYNSELKLGFGNFTSPLAAFRHFNSDDDQQYGVSLFHESYLTGPVRKESSGAAAYRALANYQRKFGEYSWESRLSWTRDDYYFFGLSDAAFAAGEPAVVTGRSNWTVLSASTALSGNHRQTSFSIQPKLDFISNVENQGERFGQELNFGVVADFTHRFNDKNAFQLHSSNQLSNYDLVDGARTRFTLQPEYRTAISVIDITLGFQLNFVDDIVRNAYSQIGAVMSLELPLAENWKLKAGIGNELQQNRLLDLHLQNQFLFDSLELRSTIVKIPFHARIQGSVTRALTVFGGMNIQDQEYALYFVPAESDSSRFQLRYDEGDLSIFEYVFGFVLEPDPSFHVSASFSVFENGAGSEAEAWYRPTSSLSVNLSKQFGAFSFSANADLIGGLQAPTMDENAVALQRIIDTGVFMSYTLNEQFVIFTNWRNLLNRKFEHYLNYPSRTLEAKVGLSYKF